MKKKTFFNILHTAGVSKFLRSQKKNMLTVLSLHRISPDTDFFWNPITPANFEALLQYLLHHYSIISFSEIAGIKPTSKAVKPYLVLSFDDGYYDFYEYALPLLAKFGLPSNHNIVNECATNNQAIWTQRLNHLFNHCRTNLLTDLSFSNGQTILNLAAFKNNWMQFYLSIYKMLLNTVKPERLQLIKEKEDQYSIYVTERMMNWTEIIECSKHKVEIGSHTYSHDSLCTIDDTGTLYHEIAGSKREIEQYLGNKVNILALPNGQGNPGIHDIAEKEGINHILFVGDKINRLNSFTDNRIIHDIYRVNLVQESVPEMILRTELFHSKYRKYA